MEEKDLLVDAHQDPNHYTQVPNYLIESPISPTAFRVYVYIKFRTGEALDGRCFEASRNIAKACNMSTAALSRAKAELVELKLIEIKKVPGKREGEYPHDEIAIRYVWDSNRAFYSLQKPEKQAWVEELREGINSWRGDMGWRVPDQERKPRIGRRKKNSDVQVNKPL